MKQKTLFLSVCILILCLLSGCVITPGQSKPVISDDTVTVHLFAKDYIGKEKAEVESLLGGFVQEEYYNGGLIYKFARSDMWFWFGVYSAPYAEVPSDATCCLVIAPLAEAAVFETETVSANELSEKLGFSFTEPTYNELDCLYNYAAEQDGISCFVTCADDGTVFVNEDIATYTLAK
ncbi:MAG: hypothetical protein IJC78_00365 [Clostridia bacterium]|nr:hypothetical protein [Clostridia bacterium]